MSGIVGFKNTAVNRSFMRILALIPNSFWWEVWIVDTKQSLCHFGQPSKMEQQKHDTYLKTFPPNQPKWEENTYYKPFPSYLAVRETWRFSLHSGDSPIIQEGWHRYILGLWLTKRWQVHVHVYDVHTAKICVDLFLTSLQQNYQRPRQTSTFITLSPIPPQLVEWAMVNSHIDTWKSLL